MAAVQIIIAVIPIVVIVMGSTLIFFYFLWRHKQIIRQIETNIYVKPSFHIDLFCLLLGIVLTITGAVLSGLFYAIAGIGYILLGGLIPLSLGISLLLFYGIIHAKRNKNGAGHLPLPEGHGA